MKKIPTMFKRDPENMTSVLNEPNPDCLWVFMGEGVATRKYDGTCVLIESDGSYYKRREVKTGKKAPQGFISVSYDPATGKTVGWVGVDQDSNEDKWHMEAYRSRSFMTLPSGTYELCGPKINGNPEHFDRHVLIMHMLAETYDGVPRDFDGLKQWLSAKDVEGLVFHHPDGK